MARSGQGAPALIAGSSATDAATGDRESSHSVGDRRPGARPRAGRASLAWGVGAVVAAALPAWWMWDFTIDDALISVRYARHLADGSGYRFNPLAPSTDGVTPLPWPLLLAPFARAGALAVLGRAKWIGLLAWLAAAFAWGRAVGRAPASFWVKGIALGALATCVPVAAHAVSGMETGLAIALATWAALVRRPLRAAWIAGAVAALRPEMVVWAVALMAARRSRGGALIAAAPFLACAGIRLVAFGHVAPLAIAAKPSDVTHGLSYAAAAALVSLAPVLALAPLALARARRADAAGHPLAITLAALAHLGAVVFAGGDWMPFARLVAPVAPSLLYAFVLAAPHAHRAATAARVALTAGIAGFVLVGPAAAGRHVGAQYRALVDAARPHLASRSVASLDIGWPTALTDATITDLAGLTDPTIAALPGGHTSKRIDPAFLLERAPDVVLLYVAAPPDLSRWQDALFTRVVDARIAASPLIARHYEARAFLPHGTKSAGYLVLTRTR